MRLDRFLGIAIALNVIVAMFALPGCGGGGGENPPLPRAVVDPPVVEPPAVEQKITTSFGATGLDHYPLAAKRLRPERPEVERPERPNFLTCGANDQDCLAYNEELLDAYEAALDAYEAAPSQYEEAMADYELGRCCWTMVADESNIASREDVLAMLQENTFIVTADPPFFEGPDGDVARGAMWVFIEPPSVRFVEQTSRQARAAALRAIDNINAWLPWDRHVTVGADLDSAASAAARENAEVDVEPDHDRIEAALFGRLSPGDVVAYLDAENLGDGVAGNAYSSYRARPDAIWSQLNVQRGSSTSVRVIQHELLHILGLNGGRACYETFGANCDTNSFDGPQFYYSHVPVSKFPESTMAYASPRSDTYGLSQIDGEVLQAIYTREGLWGEGASDDIPGSGPPDGEDPTHFEIRRDRLSPESLGPWDDTVVRYSGNFDPALGPDWYFEPRFGVDWRNGMARPWAHGDITYNTFADSGLSGTVTWSGELVGFTPEREAVRGESAIQVDIAALNGDAAFTGLEHWASGAAPGNAGTGARWQDGDLHYSIALDGNHIRSNGGDAGYVSGRFVGEEHQGAVGILEHPDLAGAFGATR